jgi:hypothetical protein
MLGLPGRQRDVDTKINLQKPLGCFIVLILSILAISFLTMRSLNPLTVYAAGSLWAKIVITILAVLSLPALLYILVAGKAVVGWIILFGVAIFGYSLFLDDPAQDGQVKAAYFVLDRLKIPNAENEIAWGITDFQIFADARRFWINSPRKTGNEVVIPIWIRGIDSHGNSGQWKMKLHVHVEPVLNGFKGKDFSLEQKEPLSGWEQLGRWMLWCLMIPIAIVGFLFGSNVLSSALENAGCLWAVILLALLGWLSFAGYFAYAFFGSIWAVVFGVLFWIVLAIILISAITNHS